MNPELSARIGILFPAIVSRAETLHFKSGQLVETDDLAQEMALHIIERAEADPDRLERGNDAYLLKDAAWNKGSCVVRSEIRRLATISENVKIGEEPEEDDEAYVYCIPAIGYTPEQHAEYMELYRTVAKAFQFLCQIDQQILKLKLAGEKEGEIARQLGISKSRVSQRKREIQNLFTRFLSL